MTMNLMLVGMFVAIVVSPVSSVQLTYTRNRVIMGSPGETVMTCAVDETDIRDIYSIQLSVYSRTFPTGKTIGLVDRNGLDDATTANLGDLANRVTITGSIATNLRESRITVAFDTEKIQCTDAANYECTINYLNNAVRPVPVTHSVNTSLEVYEYPVMGKLIVKHNGMEINEETFSNNPTFKIGDQIELSCSANVGSINTTLIQWRRTTETGTSDIWNEYQPSAAASEDGQAVKENCGYTRTATILYNITIADANRLNNLGFECYVRVFDSIYNNYVTPESLNPNFYFIVYYPPTYFTIQPSVGSPGPIGGSKILLCRTNCNPAPEYRWLKNGVYLNESNSYTYRMITMNLSDVGQYRCVASNYIGAILSGPADVKVAYMSPFRDKGLTFAKATNTSNYIVIQVPYIDSYPRPIISWYINSSTYYQALNGEASYHQITLNGSLVLLDRKREDSGSYYKIEALNGITSTLEEGPVYYVTVSGATSTTRLPPTLVIGPSNQIVYEDQDTKVDFECIVNASPVQEVQISWYRVTGDIKNQLFPDAHYLISTISERVLTIVSPRQQDSGVYQCEAFLTGFENRVVASAILTVYVSPTFSNQIPGEINEYFGQNVTINCTANGNPSPAIYWYFNAKQIAKDFNSSNYKVHPNGSLTVTQLDLEHAGMYQCFLRNAAGETSKATFLRVKVNSSPPVMETPPSNITVLEGEIVRFSCDTKGTPKPVIHWYREILGGILEEINDSGRIQILDHGELLIASTARTDSGKYTCNSSNSQGYVTASVWLRVFVGSVQLTFTRNRVIMGSPGETVMTCAVDETDIRDIFLIQVSVYSRTFPTGKVIALVTKTGLDDATTANLGDLANRIRIEGSIATNLRDSRITVTFDAEKLQCTDAANYECTINYINNAVKPVSALNSVNTSLEVYEYPVMGKLVVRHNGIEVNERTSSNNPTFKVGDQIELSCSANVGSINTTLIQWRRTSEIGKENIWNEYQPSATASDNGQVVRENCGYLRTATIHYNMTIADANRQNNLGFECYVRVSDLIYNNYVTPEATNPKFYADVSIDNGGNAQQDASAAATAGVYGAIIGGAVGGGVACAIILAVAILLIWRLRIRKGNGEPPSVLNETTAHYTDLQTSQHQYANKTSDYSRLNTRPGNGEPPSVLNDTTANYTDLQTSQFEYANKAFDYSKLNTRPGNGETHSVLNETTANYTDLQASQHEYANKTSDYSKLNTRPGEKAFESSFPNLYSKIRLEKGDTEEHIYNAINSTRHATLEDAALKT